MKRAIMYSTVVLLIIVLVGFVGFSIIIAEFDDGVQATKDIDRCRLSVLKAGAIKGTLPGGSTSLVNINVDCPRITTEVTERDVMTGGKVSQDLIRMAMADELKDCWYKMGKGSAGGFNQNILKSLAGTLFDSKKDYACLVCSSITYDHEVVAGIQKGYGTEVVGDFVQFLDETPYSPGQSESYLDYLSLDTELSKSTFFAVSKVSSPDHMEAMDEIDLTKTYHVFYVIYKGDYIMNQATSFVDWLQSKLGFSTDLGLFDKDEAYGSIFVADGDHVRDVKCAAGLLN